jgi:hypothetical protein
MYSKPAWLRALLAFAAYLIVAASAFAQPAACTSGNDPFSSSPWVVCQSDKTSAWLSGQSGGGTYHALAICKALGYNGPVTQFGGNCNSVCGFCDGAHSCSSTGTKFFDGQGNQGSDANGIILATTVTWLCSGQIQQTLTQIPTLTEVALVALVLALAGVGMFYVRRRSRSAP